MDDGDGFTAFVREVEPRLRQALIGVCGPEEGRDAVADALAYAWQHWKRVSRMANPAGYVYRVARSRTRRRKMPRFPPPDPARIPEVEPALPGALAALPERQRVCTFLVHGCDWSPTEVAELLGLSVSSVRNHVARGLASLRRALEVTTDD